MTAVWLGQTREGIEAFESEAEAIRWAEVQVKGRNLEAVVWLSGDVETHPSADTSPEAGRSALSASDGGSGVNDDRVVREGNR